MWERTERNDPGRTGTRPRYQVKRQYSCCGGIGVFSSPQTKETKRLLSADELARELGVGRTTAYSLLWSGTIPSMKVGRLRKVRRVDLEAYLAERMESAR